MLQVYTDSQNGVVTPLNTSIVFNNKSVETGCTVTANEPTNTVVLRRQGFYKVTFDGTIANNSGASTVVGVTMTRNGVEVPEAKTGATSTNAIDVRAVSFSTLVRVMPNCAAVDNTARLQFKITGANTVVYHANVVVTKIA